MLCSKTARAARSRVSRRSAARSSGKRAAVRVAASARVLARRGRGGWLISTVAPPAVTSARVAQFDDGRVKECRDQEETEEAAVSADGERKKPRQLADNDSRRSTCQRASVTAEESGFARSRGPFPAIPVALARLVIRIRVPVSRPPTGGTTTG